MKKIRVFDSPDDLPKDRCSLLAVSNKYGLTFVGLDTTLKVFFTKDIIAAGKVEGNPNEIGKCEDLLIMCWEFFSSWKWKSLCRIDSTEHNEIALLPYQFKGAAQITYFVTPWLQTLCLFAHNKETEECCPLPLSLTYLCFMWIQCPVKDCENH